MMPSLLQIPTIWTIKTIHLRVRGRSHEAAGRPGWWLLFSQVNSEDKTTYLNAVISYRLITGLPLLYPSVYFLFTTLCFCGEHTLVSCIIYLLKQEHLKKRNLLFPNPDNCGILLGDLGIWPEIGYKSITGMSQRLLRRGCTLHQHPILTFPHRGNAA